MVVYYPPNMVVYYPPNMVVYYPPNMVVYYPPNMFVYYPPNMVVYYPPNMVVYYPPNIHCPQHREDHSCTILRSGLSVVRDAKNLYVNTRWCWILVLCICVLVLTLSFPKHIVIAQRITEIKLRMGGIFTRTPHKISKSLMSIPQTHHKCRNQLYPRGKNITRFEVPDDKVLWTVPFPEYKPREFVSEAVLGKPVWADPDFKTETPATPPKWNALDGNIDRRSHMGEYKIVKGVPRNPVGRTGICLRGTLGRWGPNHAADPIVTRWKRNEKGNKITDENTKKPILQFVCIKRHDNGDWAIPGGMVDAGEQVSTTLKREFMEEAMSNTPNDQSNNVTKKVSELFSSGKQVYKGYVDDPRNTDNSWMETIAVNFHDEEGNTVGMFKLHAGDDAVGVRWMDINSTLQLFATHVNFVKLVADLHKAHW
ncbi:ADP-ribose pyrophosphatase, mitochondrial [Lamellibrachia satsuma]|nr:ADP-ribose pyrophosphatase, mitochondrial [Lamellibrachia satsuma]